jgi:hypothetical protein
VDSVGFLHDEQELLLLGLETGWDLSGGQCIDESHRVAIFLDQSPRYRPAKDSGVQILSDRGVDDPVY